MAVLQFKPSRLSYLIALPGYEDDNGNYHPGEQSWEGDIECGYSPAGAANVITYEDGSTAVYSYTVTLPISCKNFAKGDRVRIKMLNGLLQEFTVKSFMRYQLQCKIWI